MPNPKSGPDFRNVSILARGALLVAIETRASERDIALGRAAASFIEEALKAGAVAPASTVLVNLESVSTDDLIDELVGRLQQISTVEVANARAEAAEARLLQIAAALGGATAGAA